MMESEYSLPPRFTERLQAILPPPAFEAALARMQGAARCCFRVNTLRKGIGETITQLRADDFDPQAWR